MKSGLNKKKIIVAMSGGVDSSVAAALLKKDGFYPEPGRRIDVIGAYMRLWKDSKRGKSDKDEKRAQKVAKKLEISFKVLDFRNDFKKKVVDCFLDEFKKGNTPNPCVICNKEIKFELLFKKLKEFKADYIATGHYVKKDGDKLLKGIDKNKDQSYFLWKLNQKILKKVLFPIGDYKKSEVKKLAKKFDLPVIDINESQEICFIPDTMNDFLKRYLKTKPGDIVNTKGEKMGRHNGLWFYTIGQRKGIPLTAGPYYVLDKDIKKNLLVVTKKEKDLYKKELFVKDVNWIKKPKLSLKAMAQIRYGHKPVSAKIIKDKNNRIKVIFSRYQRAITPGQSVVFYKDNELLGGGVISSIK